MSNHSYQYTNPRKLLANLSKEISQRQIQNRSQQIKEIVGIRKQKLRSIYLTQSHELMQPDFHSTRNIHPEFSILTPIATEQPFISQKIKENILRPQRFYSKQPNMKAGSFSVDKKRSLVEKQIIVSRKFEEYSRIVDEQSGGRKIQKLAKLIQQRRSVLDDTSQKYTRMKKTYFQRFMPDKYNIYIPNSKNMFGADSSSVRKSRTNAVTISDTDYLDSKKDVATVRHKELRIQSEADSGSHASGQKYKSMVGRSRMKTVLNYKNLQSLP